MVAGLAVDLVSLLDEARAIHRALDDIVNVLVDRRVNGVGHQDHQMPIKELLQDMLQHRRLARPRGTDEGKTATTRLLLRDLKLETFVGNVHLFATREDFYRGDINGFAPFYDGESRGGRSNPG